MECRNAHHVLTSSKAVLTERFWYSEWTVAYPCKTVKSLAAFLEVADKVIVHSFALHPSNRLPSACYSLKSTL